VKDNELAQINREGVKSQTVRPSPEGTRDRSRRALRQCREQLGLVAPAGVSVPGPAREVLEVRGACRASDRLAAMSVIRSERLLHVCKEGLCGLALTLYVLRRRITLGLHGLDERLIGICRIPGRLVAIPGALILTLSI
jgi:hypothetical protein